MQLYALEGTSPIASSSAEKGKDYLCPECRTQVRLRGGPSRQTHFYHFRPSKNCRQNQKSLEHLQMQLKLLDLIGDAHLECPFPEIERIADVAWHARKIVFEVQCSPISLEEAQTRTLDYQKAGYQVFWILHDKQFNQQSLSAAESYLRTQPCYFTNINKIGEGIVYDQFEVLKKERRLFKGCPLTVSPVKIFRLPKASLSDEQFPKMLLNRFLTWESYAKGDLLYRLLRESSSAKGMLAIELHHEKEKKETLKRLPLRALLAKSYLAALDWLLTH